MDKQVTDIILAEIRDLKSDVRQLLEFKWKIYGMTVMISAIIGFGVQIIIAQVTNQSQQKEVK